MYRDKLAFGASSLAVLMVGGCAALTGPSAFHQQMANERAAYEQANAEAGAHTRKRIKFLLSCGAMSDLDRAEVELSRAIDEARYGKDYVKDRPRSQRCQDYAAHKITIDEAVARGPGADESKMVRKSLLDD